MDFTARVLFVLFSLLTAFLYQQYRQASRPLEAPTFDAKQYWGPGDAALYKEDATIKPFKVSYGEQVISKLRARLEDEPNYAEPLEGTAFEYGFNSKKLRSVVKYWRTTYLDKWSERQQFFNQFEQFRTQIQG
jgi:juvenile hormone epoxide hydrolase